MKKMAFLLWILLAQQTAWAAWVYFDGNYGNALQYYDPNIEVKGKSSTLRIFNMLSVQDMVPIYDAGAPKHLRMVVYSSELSTYEDVQIFVDHLTPVEQAVCAVALVLAVYAIIKVIGKLRNKRQPEDE